MKLWKISQGDNNDYDTYDCAVVAAETEEDARNTHPSGHSDYDDNREYPKYGFGTWVERRLVEVEYIGEAAPGTPAGVICASFNAG